jgi:hypothetical protein
MQGGHDVDHAISVKLWQKLMSSTSQISEDQMESGHRLGNCVLLKPTFNISKGSRSLSEWLDKLSKAAPNLMDRLEWQKSLLLSDEFLNPLNYSLDQIEKAIDERTVSIRAELKQFVSGDKFRTD